MSSVFDLLRRWWVGAAFGGVLLVYALSLPPSITFEDSGELAVAVRTLGVAHPPGYPTYLLAARLFSHGIPWGDPAYRTNLFSAVAAVAGLVVLYAFLKELSSDRTLALATVLLTAFSRTFWNTAVITEVYTLNFLFWMVLVWLAFRYTEPDGPFGENSGVWAERIPWAAAFLLGLGSGNHQMLLLGVPAFLLLFRRDGRHPRPVSWAVAFGFFLLGLAVYAYLPIRAVSFPFLNWGDPSDWEGFWKVVAREQYGDIGKPGWDAALWLRQCLTINPVYEYFGGLDFFDLRRRFRWFLLIPWSLAFGIAAWGWLSDPRRKGKSFLLASAILYGPFLVGLTRTPPEKEFTLKVFFLPLWPVFGYYFLRGAGEVSARVLKAPRWTLLLFPLVSLALNREANQFRDYPYAVDYQRNLLVSLPYRGLLFTIKDNETFPLWYAQGALGLRPDAAVVNHITLSEPWYRRSLRRTYPGLASLPEPRAKGRDRARAETFGWFFSAGSSPAGLFAANRELPVPSGWRFAPWGSVYRILPDGPTDIAPFPADHGLSFRGLESTVAEKHYDVMTLLMVQTYARLAEDAGDAAVAAGRREEAWKQYGRSVRLNRLLGFEVNNFRNHVQMGRLLMEQGRVEEGKALWRTAISLQPQSEAARRLAEALMAMERRAVSGAAGRAESLYRQGRYAEAARLYHEALRQGELPPARAYANIGDCHFQMGDHAEAASWYRKAIAADPDYITPYYNLGGALLTAGHREEALRIWREGLRRSPDHPLLKEALRTYGGGR